MTRTTGLIVIVGALSLIGITLWFLADEGPSTETPTTTSIATDGGPTEDATPPELPVADSAGERPVQSLDTAAVDASPDVAQTTVATPTVLTGRVTRAGDGRPVAGVEVSARLSPAGGATAATPVAVTDADGVYSIEPGHGGTLVRLDVASGPDTTRTTLRTERAVPEGERTTVDVEVTKGVALAGTVVDGDGRPVADAEVRAWTGARFTIERERSDAPDRVVRTDAAGSFEVVAVGPRFLLEARAEGSVAADRLHGEIPVGKRAAGLVLHVSPTRSLRVEVRGRDGRTLASASVVARHALHGASEKITDFEGVFRSGPRQISGTTDADGRAELPDLASLVYDVEVEHGSHAPWSGQHAPGDPDLLVRLDPGALLFGTVTDVGGAGISQAQVQVSSADHSLMDRNSRRTRSDEDGRFEFGGLLTDDAALLSVAAPGHAVRVVEGLPVHEDTPREVRVILGPEYALAGLVTDPTGTPVAKALVEIEGDRLIDFGGMTMSPTPTWERMFHALDRTHTDESGRFRLGSLYDGLFRVRVTHPEDAAIVAVQDARSDGAELHVVLDPDATAGVTLAGKVRDALTGRPITEFQVTPMIPSGEGGLAGTSHIVGDEQGRFRVSGLEPGAMQVDVQAKGYAPWTQTLRDYGPGLHLLDVALVASRTVRLRFVDEERAPVVDADVRFATVDGKELMVASGPASRTTALSTDAQGEVIASELPADRIVVGLKRGWLDGGRVYTVDLRVPPPPLIELVVGGSLRVELVFLVVANQSGAEQTATGGIDGVLTLQARLQDGSLNTLDVPAHVEVRDGAGVLVAEGSTTPGAAPTEGGVFAVEAAAVRVSVPREVLSIRVTAPGYAPAELSWTPRSNSMEGDMIAVMLVPH